MCACLELGTNLVDSYLTPASLLEDGINYQEGKWEDCETDIQLVFGEFSIQFGIRIGVFLNIVAHLGDQIANKEVDQENPSAKRVMVEEEKPEVYEFPIRETSDQVRMKNINPTTFPNFHDLTTKDPNTFLFEFEVVYRTYDYVLNAQKLKIFPSIFKDSSFMWFMSLKGNSIKSWE